MVVLSQITNALGGCRFTVELWTDSETSSSLRVGSLMFFTGVDSLVWSRSVVELCTDFGSHPECFLLVVVSCLLVYVCQFFSLCGIYVIYPH